MRRREQCRPFPFRGKSNRYDSGAGEQRALIGGECVLHHSAPIFLDARSPPASSPGAGRAGRATVSAIGSAGTAARYALGGIRVLNGALGLVAPAVIIRRLGDRSPQDNAAAYYGVRLFGVRTIVLGADLFLLRGRELEGALRSAVLIHGSDTSTVLSLWRRRQLAPELARPLALISGLNTALAVTAFLSRRRAGA